MFVIAEMDNLELSDEKTKVTTFCVFISAGSSLQTIGTDGSGNQVLLTYGNAGQFAQLN